LRSRMTVACPVDKTQHPDRARFCMTCGRPLSEDAVKLNTARWERKELSVRLGFSASKPIDVARFDKVVQEALDRARKDGWTPEEETDYESLAEAKRIRRDSGGLFGSPTHGPVVIKVRRWVTS